LHRRIDLHYDIYIKELYNKFVIKLESFLTLGSKKRIQLMLHYIDIRPSDVLLDVSGNIGKITVFTQEVAKKLLFTQEDAISRAINYILRTILCLKSAFHVC